MKRWVAWLLGTSVALSVLAAVGVAVGVGGLGLAGARPSARQCANGVCYNIPKPPVPQPTRPVPQPTRPVPVPQPGTPPRPAPPKETPAKPPRPPRPASPPKPSQPPRQAPAKPPRPAPPPKQAPHGPAQVPHGQVPTVVPGATCTETRDVDKFPAGKVSGKPGPGVPVRADNGVLAITCLPGKFGSAGGVVYRFPNCVGSREVLVTFDVKFGDSAAFDFVKGGKAGWGLSFGTEKFQGGVWPKNSASARVMWRKGGQATGYAYYGSKSNGADPKEQLPEYADVGRPTGGAGHTLWETGKSRDPMVAFKSGVWQTVRLYVRMNSAGAHDGAIGIAVDGDARRFDKMKWVESPVGLDNAEFCTWFGGSDASWSPRTPQTIYYRNFRFSGK
jgi:hypothetical protein